MITHMRERMDPPVFDPKSFGTTGKQFNLIDYSTGALAAAQNAAEYTSRGGKVDNLVLIGAPIGATFLDNLKKNPNIGKVIVINLTDKGDPIRPGMSNLELLRSVPALAVQMSDNAGHFYFAPEGRIGNERRRKLARQLFDMGLR